MTEFDTAWAAAKLDMPKRRRELEAYISKWLPELRTPEPDIVLDIGCGPGDFLALCHEMGFDVIGIDDFSGTSPMGKAYTDLCQKHCEKFGVEVFQYGLFRQCPQTWQQLFSVIHCRGAIEQIGEHAMSGPPHSAHHDCRQLNWTADAIPFLREFVYTCSQLLKPDGILLIAANGTGETDGWYDEIIRRSGDESGLELVAQDGMLLHKWRKR